MLFRSELPACPSARALLSSIHQYCAKHSMLQISNASSTGLITGLLPDTGGFAFALPKQCVTTISPTNRCFARCPKQGISGLAAYYHGQLEPETFKDTASLRLRSTQTTQYPVCHQIHCDESGVTKPFPGIERCQCWNNRWFGRAESGHDMTGLNPGYGLGRFFYSAHTGDACTQIDTTISSAKFAVTSRIFFWRKNVRWCGLPLRCA